MVILNVAAAKPLMMPTAGVFLPPPLIIKGLPGAQDSGFELIVATQKRAAHVVGPLNKGKTNLVESHKYSAVETTPKQGEGKRRLGGIISSGTNGANAMEDGALSLFGAFQSNSRGEHAQEAGAKYFSGIQSAPWALFTDMDGTLFNPGEAPTPASLAAWQRILGVLRGNEVRIPLVYVTGRSSLAGIIETQVQYGTAEPDVIAAAGGSTVYAKNPATGGWVELPQWFELLSSQWPEETPINRLIVKGEAPPMDSPADIELRKRFVEQLLAGPLATIVRQLLDLPGGRIQKASSQRDFRRSFFADASLNEAAVQKQIDATLCNLAAGTSPGCEASLKMEDVYSRLGYRVVVSKDKQHLLIDILPASGTKSGAMTFLSDALGLSPERIFFSGDSGNDLDALTWSGFATFVGAKREGFAEWLTLNSAGLRKPGQLPIYLSPLPQIFGVEDGLGHFGLMKKR